MTDPSEDINPKDISGECDGCGQEVKFWWVGPSEDGWSHILECPECHELEHMAVSEEQRNRGYWIAIGSWPGK